MTCYPDSSIVDDIINNIYDEESLIKCLSSINPIFFYSPAHLQEENYRIGKVKSWQLPRITDRRLEILEELTQNNYLSAMRNGQLNKRVKDLLSSFYDTVPLKASLLSVDLFISAVPNWKAPAELMSPDREFFQLTKEITDKLIMDIDKIVRDSGEPLLASTSTAITRGREKGGLNTNWENIAVLLARLCNERECEVINTRLTTAKIILDTLHCAYALGLDFYVTSDVLKAQKVGIVFNLLGINTDVILVRIRR